MVELNINLPSHFLDEEIRSGFTVSRQLKEVWAVELDLLQEFILVCRRLNLRFFADGGTLLGAVRHKGFIPWDDDIDLVMLRDDYDSLVRAGPDEFKYPYFFQSVYTEKGYFRGHAQLRNSDTTGILKNEYGSRFGFNQGIFIDIFVLDGVPENEKKLNRLICSYSRMRKIRDYTPTKYHFIYKNVFRMEENCLRKNKISECEKAGALSFYFDPEKMKLNRHIYDDTVLLPFEFLEIPAPLGFDEYLVHQYGDYMTPVNNPTQHGNIIFDTERPYTEYLLKS